MPGVLDTALCGKVNAFVSDLRQVGGSPGTPVSFNRSVNESSILIGLISEQESNQKIAVVCWVFIIYF
jgi:hypothetical protein